MINTCSDKISENCLDFADKITGHSLPIQTIQSHAMRTATPPVFEDEIETTGFGKLQLQVFDDFEPLEKDWRNLEQTGICTVYQNFDWVANWTRLVGKAARIQPRLIVATSNGAPLFILGMCLRRRGPFMTLTFLGDSHTNFHMGLFSEDFLNNAGPDDVDSIIAAIGRNVGHADVLELCCQPVTWQGRINPFSFLRGQESHNHAFALDLAQGFDAAINKKNGSRKRKKHRWQQNKLKHLGGPKLIVASNEDEVDKFLDIAFRQISTRFNKAGIWNTFDDDGIDKFMRELGKSSLGKIEPEMIIFGLEIDGKVRAVFAGGIHHAQFSGCFISFAEDEYTYLSPGELIMYLAIEECVARGVKTFDLGRGEERYKTSWCDSTIAMFDTNIALTRRAIAYSAYERGKTAAKRLVRNNDTLWNVAKKFRARFYGRM